jgi:hypothetical protein
MRKLLSTFRVHLAPGFGLMLGYKEEEIANSLGSLPLKKFVNQAPTLLESSFAETLNPLSDAQKKAKKNTLYNDRANLKQFLDWIALQTWQLTSQTKPPDSSLRAPRNRTGKSLKEVRRGKGRNSYAEKYGLSEVLLEQKFPQLYQQLNLFKDYEVLDAPPDGFLRARSAVESVTAANHREGCRQFYGWGLGLPTTSERDRVLSQLQDVITALGSGNENATTFQKLEQQKQTLENQLLNLTQTISPFEARRKEVLSQLEDVESELQQKSSKKLVKRRKWLDQLLIHLETCSLELILDVALFSRFIKWGINVKGNSDAWANNHYSSAIVVATFFQNSPTPPYKIDKIIEDLRKSRTGYVQNYQSDVRAGKEEKWLNLEQQEILLAHLRACTAEYDWRGRKRSLIAILLSWQQYLLFLLLIHYPIRVGEIPFLEWGVTLTWKLDPESGREGYHCSFTADHTKTDKAKSWFLDPDVFNEPLKEWLEVWHPKAEVNHNFLFFNVRKPKYGQQLTAGSLAKRAKNTVYAGCRDLKFAAVQELERLMAEGKTEVEARKLLSKEHNVFLDLEPKRTNVHYWRHIISSLLRKNEATYAQIKAFHNIISNSVAMGDDVYNQLNLEEETAAAISWRRKLVKNGEMSEEMLDVTIDRLLGALLAILTQKQRQKLRDLGFAL